MSGHSKWSTIKRKKGAEDQKKANVFTKLANIISVAAKTNRGLDMAIEQARAANMPKDKIEKAILRGQGKIAGAAIEEIVYEAYGPGGVAIMIKALSDNKNRTVSEIRSVLNKYNGSLANAGAVSYLFEQKGVMQIDLDKIPMPKEDAQMIIIESGAEDFEEDKNQLYVYTAPKKLEEVKQNLEFKALPIESAKLELNPKTYADLAEDKKESVINLLSALEELDDVSEVFTNANL